MDKQQAAQFLGVSTRMIERYEKAGRLPSRTVRDGTTRKNVYSESDLTRLKAELNALQIRPEIEQPDTGRTIPTTTTTPQAEAHRSAPTTEALALVNQGMTVLQQFAEAVELMKRAQRPPKPLDQLAHKLTLSVAEAVALSGLPRHTIKDAITSGELQARKVGRGDRIHRDDLNRFLHGFFSKTK
jgi:excisionase family DNA binding protein